MEIVLPEWQGGKIALLLEGASAFWCFRTFAVLRIEWPVQLSVIGKVELPRVKGKLQTPDGKSQ